MKLFLSLFCAAGLYGQIETVQVKGGQPERTVHLTGELLPFEAVEIFARVNGYVERVLVDRGSLVRKGQLLVELSAPELSAQVAETESRVQMVEAQKVEAEARLASSLATYNRLKKASETAGAIAGNELLIAEKTVAAAKALVASFESAKAAAQANVNAVKQNQSYLRITAPFDGSVVERRIHPGALVGPSHSASGEGMLRIEQTARLRLVAAVPEAQVGAIVRRARVAFNVPAYPSETFFGTVARIPRSLDTKTRTLSVELDVLNQDGKLAAGMYPSIDWPVRRRGASLLVPPSSVASNTELTFVIRVVRGKAEWVNVKKGAVAGELVEIFGDLRPGDTIVRRATDEIRDGSNLKTKPPAAQ